MSEFELIGRYFARAPKHALQGVGDDCARVRVAEGAELVVTTDLLTEGRHFLAGTEPRSLGHKCLAVNLSDLAAAGAAPRWITLAIALTHVDEAWLEAFSGGLFALAERYGVDLVGGDTTRGSVLTVSITAMGEVPAGQAMTRSGARPGDDLWVSGELGGAALALVHPEIAAAARRLHEPQPRIELGQKLRGLASAAIDVSDGLVGDLGHILERSAVGAVVHYDKVPKDASFKDRHAGQLERDCVLSGGDDYELLFSAAQARRPALEAMGGITRIGSITGEAGLKVLDASGKPLAHKGGFDHFA